MPVKVGGSYVSEAAYSFAKAQVTDKSEDSGGVLKSLAEKFPNLKFSVGTKPFSGTGMNNVSISPKILKQMEKDPEKRMEYEALIYDIAHTDVQSGRLPEHKLKSHGFIIEDDGGLRSWGISQYDDGNRKEQSHVKRSNKGNWWQELLPKQNAKKKKSASKALQEKIAARKKEILPAKQEATDNSASLLAALRIQEPKVNNISTQNTEKIQGNPALAKAYLQNSKMTANNTDFKDTNELANYLWENFQVYSGGMTKISGKFLQKCLTDEESRNKLFDTLRTADEAYASRKDEVGFQGMRVIIDEDGEVTMESTMRTVSINEEKRRRQIAAAATQNDMQAVLAILQQDLQELEDGYRQNACDAAEVEKAKKLIEQAKQQMGQLPDRKPTPEEANSMTVNMLI